MENIIDNIVSNNPQYRQEAFYYVARVIESLHDKIVREEHKRRHVSGRELVTEMLRLAGEDYGYLAYTVFEEWGIHTTEDIGEIVFLMVENGILSAQSSDSRDDFKDLCNLKKTFEEKYSDFNVK